MAPAARGPDPGPNRIESYEDELLLLELARASLVARGKPELAGALDPTKQEIAATRELDRELFQEGKVDLRSRADTDGAAGRMGDVR